LLLLHFYNFLSDPKIK